MFVKRKQKSIVIHFGGICQFLLEAFIASWRRTAPPSLLTVLMSFLRLAAGKPGKERRMIRGAQRTRRMRRTWALTTCSVCPPEAGKEEEETSVTSGWTGTWKHLPFSARIAA